MADGSPDVTLREVTAADVAVFFEHQQDPDAAAMAAFPTRTRDAHVAHWEKIGADPTVIARTIDYEGEVAGNIVAWIEAGRREVGYWIGRRYWGRGVATAALARFVEIVQDRPLYAHVAVHNPGSARVLEKCGFSAVSRHIADGVEERLFVLDT